MKTFNGKHITKKYIVSVIRTLDSTKIYKLVHDIYGEVNQIMVYKFIREFAPTNKIYDASYKISSDPKNRMNPYRFQSARKSYEFQEMNMKHIVVDYLKEQVKDVRSNYAKRPMLGFSHLYFCSPVYGHRDYNKYQSIEIKGNERFCAAVIAYADKFFAPVYDNK